MISTEIEILETLHDDVQEFINTHPSWSNEGVMSEALKLFLLAQKKSDRTEKV